MSDNLTTILVGTGSMAIEYSNVLEKLIDNFDVIGRGKINAINFKEKTNKNVILGGIENYIETIAEIPTHAIVAVNVEALASVTMKLLKSGVKNILVEKPAGLSIKELKQIEIESKTRDAIVYVAYNRRFYSSVEKAMKIIEEDMGVTSFHFDFTEWGHIISKLEISNEIKKHWFFANSTHVVDLAFYLGGYPIYLNPLLSGNGNLEWHPAASVFVGSGVTDNGALFSYHSNWESAGRWRIEIMTNKHRLIFSPMEQLHIQKLGNVQIEKVSLDDEKDISFKPGLFNQVKAFIFGYNQERLLDIAKHRKLAEDVYIKMLPING